MRALLPALLVASAQLAYADAATPVPPADADAAAQVTIRIDSQPPGATVTDEDAHAVLGVTPLRLRWRRGASLHLFVEKEGGWDTTWVDTRSDQTLRFELLPLPEVRAHLADLIEHDCPAPARPIA